MTFNLKRKNILVQEVDRSDTTRSGLILPPSATKDINDVTNWFGEVIGVGDEVEGISIGDTVVIDPTVPYPGFKHPITGKSCMFVTYNQILSSVNN